MRSGRQIAEAWLHAKLSTITDEVYRAPAPNEAAYPHIAISLMNGNDVRAIGDPTAVERLIYDVSAWDKGDSAQAVNTLAVQIIQAIDSAPPDHVEGGTLLACKRYAAVPITQIIENSERYQRDGALYEITVLVTRDR